MSYMPPEQRITYYKRMMDYYRKEAQEALKRDDRGAYHASIGKVGDYQQLLEKYNTAV